jgi:hypothetical protein
MTTKPKKRQKLVDLKQYCTQLTVAPSANLHDDYQGCDRFYICGITQNPCIAKDIIDTSDNCDRASYSRPVINTDLLETCPAHNVSNDLADLLKKAVFQKRVSELEAKMGVKK